MASLAIICKLEVVVSRIASSRSFLVVEGTLDGLSVYTRNQSSVHKWTSVASCSLLWPGMMQLLFVLFRVGAVKWLMVASKPRRGFS